MTYPNVFLENNFITSTHIPSKTNLSSMSHPHDPSLKMGTSRGVSPEQIRGNIIFRIHYGFLDFIVVHMIYFHP
jgi:hypothetical protein